jgi:hydrogenase maturation protease
VHLLLGARLENRAQVIHVIPAGDERHSAATPRAGTLVLGVGSMLCGDDSVGPCLIDMLAGRSLPPGARVQYAGLPGWALPNWLEGWRSVFLVDAVDMGLSAGCWRRFRPEEVKLWLQDGNLSLHQPDLASGLALAEALDLLPEQLYLYGVQPAQTDPGAPLSPQVSACLPGLADQIILDLGKIQYDTKANPHC